MTLAACPNCGYSKTPPGKSSCYNCGRPLPAEGETPVAGTQVAPAASPPPWASQPAQAAPPATGSAQPDVPNWAQPAQVPAASVPPQVVSPAAPGWAAITIAACPNCGYAKTPPGKRSCYNCGRPLPVGGAAPAAGPQVAPAASPAASPTASPPPWAAQPSPAIGACPNCGYSKTPPGKRSCYNCGRPLPVEGETPAAASQVAPASMPAPPPPAPPAWAPTHRVPAAGMAAWDKPDGSQPPIAQLPAYVELVVEANAGAWAQVRASNGWRGWVDGRLLTPVPPA